MECTYEIYKSFIKEPEKDLIINIKDIDKNSIYNYIEELEGLISDVIALDYKNLKLKKIGVKFNDNTIINLSIFDLFINLCLWYSVVLCDDVITKKHIVFKDSITQNTIKDFYDKFIINKFKTTMPVKLINNIIADSLYLFGFVDKFSFYFSNSINIEDDIDMMEAIPRYRELLHHDFSDTKFSDLKRKRLDYIGEVVEYVKDAKKYIGRDHIYTNPFRAKQLINLKQLAEFMVAIGTKPDGAGGVIPHIANNSFLTGGADDIISYYIDSSGGRIAQILAKRNVGDSGDFSRVLGLNNQESFLHPNPNYSCDTKHFLRVTFDSKAKFKLFIGMYYYNEDGNLVVLKDDDYPLVAGKTLYFRSPITCASAARGEGICYKCYGDLAYINSTINIGKYATETTGRFFTQRLLSAKHLIDIDIDKIDFPEEFDKVFYVNQTEIFLNEELENKQFVLKINLDSIKYLNENDVIDLDDDDIDFLSAYVNYITIHDNEKDEDIEISSPIIEKMFLSKQLIKYISKADVDTGILSIPVEKLSTSSPLFIIEIKNNDMQSVLFAAKQVLNKYDIVESFNNDYSAMFDKYISLLIKDGIHINAVHSAIIISNQIRHKDKDGIYLERPDWSKINEPIVILSLHSALMKNPSITTSLSYQKVSEQLKNPYSYLKKQPASIDYFFMEQPQNFLNKEFEYVEDDRGYRKRNAVIKK